jgi:uncharacterized protein YqeY
MSIKDKLTEDMKTAMKSGEKHRLETIRTVIAQMKDAIINMRGTGKEFTEQDEIQVLLNASKKRKEAMELYEKGGRQDLYEKEKKELEIISEYLPKQMPSEEAEKLIESIISQVGATSAKDIGKVMSVAMKELKGKIDGKVVQEIVKKKLG